MLWFGNPAKASKVVLYLHGGGFIIPASPGHLELVWQNFVRTGHEVGVDVAVCLLQYTLLVEGQFPLPLRQTAAALDVILQSGVAPADVFIGGDSAGGNLTMQLIGHLLHPFDGVTRINLQEQQLGGIILISPGLSIDSNYASFRDNANYDMVPSDILAIVSRYRPEGTAENYARTMAAFATGDYTDAEPYQMPISAPEAWLDGIDKVVKRVYLTAGERELIRDHAVALERLLRKKGLGDDVFTFEKAEGEGHVFIVLEGMTGQVGDATRRMKEWVTGAVRG
jgi:acetyl esterase/lipase